MKYIIGICLSFLLSRQLAAQLPVSADSIYTLIKSQSIHGSNANWAIIEAGYREKLRAAHTDIDTLQSLLYVFEQLGDVHSYFGYKGKQLSNYPSFSDSMRNALLPIVNRSQQQTGRIVVQKLHKYYIYLQIPGIQAWGDQATTYAKMMADSLCHSTTSTTKGYIIDLRLNGGGQLSSMLSGVAALLGNGYLGGGVNSDGIEVNRFDIAQGNFQINGQPMTTLQQHCIFDLQSKPVVVIIGPATRSSGSIAAIAFKQRPSTYFIGEPTADGYSTGNSYFHWGNGELQLNLSTLYNQDRAKNIYRNAVPPDQLIKGGDQFDELLNDKKIMAAVEWLRQRY